MSENFIPLNAPTFFKNEKKYLEQCIDTSWVSTAGSFVSKFENKIAEYTQSKYVIDKLKQSTKKFPGIYLEFIEKQDGPPKDKDVEIEIVNNNGVKLASDT